MFKKNIPLIIISFLIVSCNSNDKELKMVQHIYSFLKTHYFMRKLYFFAVLLVMLLASTTSKAQQFEGETTATFYGSQNYATTPISFSLTAIADAFGISDAARLADMLDDQYPENREDAIDRGFQMYEIQSDNTLFEGIYTEDEKTFTADPIGFFLNKDGDVVSRSSADDIWFYVPRWNADTDEFYFNCGRKAADASFKEGYTGTATFHLKYNGSITLSFKLTYTVEAKPDDGTAIDLVETEEGDFVLLPADIYTTDGRLVRRQAADTRGLTTGIYVIGNRKVVIR